MPRDYLPRSDSEFRTWAQNFNSFVAANFFALGLTIDESDGIGAVITDFAIAHDLWVSRRAAAQAAREGKDALRQSAEESIRQLVRRLQANPAVTDEHRQNLGITVREIERTPTPAPTSRPVATIDASQRLRHVIRFTDETTPTSRARPAGALGCEIWVKLGGEPPADPSSLTFLGTATRSLFPADFVGTDANNPAHYMLRWLGARGAKGPWSATVTATIGG